MNSLSTHEVGAVRITNGTSGGIFGGAGVSYYLTQEDTNEVMKTTNCPMCRLPPSHTAAHCLSKYPDLAAIGLNVSYTPAKNK